MTHRGAALILTLVSVLALTTLAVRHVDAARRHARMHSVARAEQEAAEIFRTSSVIAQDWLERESSRVVLPPDMREPRVEVASIDWEQRGRAYTLRVTAWDQQGMLPASGSIPEFLERSLPSEFTDARVAAIDHAERNMSHLFRYPDRESATTEVLGYLATHAQSDYDPRTRSDQLSFNTHTTPAPLLRRAFTLLQRADLDRVMGARRDGEIVRDLAAGHGSASGIRLVSRSPIWAVRTDVLVGSVRRSWWTVYGGFGGEWRVLEQHAINE